MRNGSYWAATLSQSDQHIYAAGQNPSRIELPLVPAAEQSTEAPAP